LQWPKKLVQWPKSVAAAKEEKSCNGQICCSGQDKKLIQWPKRILQWPEKGPNRSQRSCPSGPKEAVPVDEETKSSPSDPKGVVQVDEETRSSPRGPREVVPVDKKSPRGVKKNNYSGKENQSVKINYVSCFDTSKGNLKVPWEVQCFAEK